MQAIRRFERVEGSTLTINLPDEFRGRKVEVVVLVVDLEGAGSETPTTESEPHPDWHLSKPPVNERSRKVMERQAAGIPDPAFRLDDPFAPAFSEDDFDFDFPAAPQT